jgi:hypothetical protein
MVDEYLDKTSATGLVRTAFPFIAAIAVSLMPSDNYPIKPQVSLNYGDYAKANTQSVINTNSQLSENEQAEILFEFANKLVGNIQDMDYEIAQITSNRFFDMYENF